jgi:hypothetical protein
LAAEGEGMKKFHIGDVLTILTGRLVSTRHMEGVYDILNFLHQDNLFTHQLPRASNEAKPWLRSMVPQLCVPEVEVLAVGELLLMLETPSGKETPGFLIPGWLSKLAAVYGEEFELSPIPVAEILHRDPLEELREMVPAEKIIRVTEL